MTQVCWTFLAASVVLLCSAAPSQDPSELRYSAIDTRDTNLCENKPTPELWNTFNCGPYFYTQAVTSVGAYPILEAIQNDIKGEIVFECSLDNCAVNGGPWDNPEECASNPLATYVLYALAEWANLLSAVSNGVNEAKLYLDGKEDILVSDFGPGGSSRGPLSDVSTALSAVGAILGLIPDIGSFAGAALGVGNAIVGIFAQYQSITTLDETQIGNSWADTYQAIQSGLTNLVNSTLNEKDPNPYDTFNEPGSIVNQLSGGAFAQDITVKTLNIPNDITASLASAAINFLWSQSQVIVVRASSYSLNYNPCDPGRLDDQSMKYCTPNGTVYYLMVWDDNAESENGLWSYAAPGIGSIDQYGLTIEAIALASEASQERSGYQAASPNSSNIASIYTNTDFTQLSLADLVQFNLPVCDLDNTDPGLHAPTQNPDGTIQNCQQNDCAGAGPYCQDQCVFITHVYCACWGATDKNGLDWPYKNTNAVSDICYQVP